MCIKCREASSKYAMLKNGDLEIKIQTYNKQL